MRVCAAVDLASPPLFESITARPALFMCQETDFAGKGQVNAGPVSAPGQDRAIKATAWAGRGEHNWWMNQEDLSLRDKAPDVLSWHASPTEHHTHFSHVGPGATDDVQRRP